MSHERILVRKMCKICPKCGGIAEYNAYYGRTTCTRCDWESEKEKSESSGKFSTKQMKFTPSPRRKLAKV